MSNAQFQFLYSKAAQAGQLAVANLRVEPMMVQDGATTYVVGDGVCGFAWINVKPGTSKFARWLKANKLARTDSYYGGVTIWVSQFNQSMQKKEAYARAFAKVLTDNGIQAYASSRMD